jgi:type VI secretion system protein ImpA
MPLRDDLLNPIPGANSAGTDLRYDPLYDKIKEARREDDDAPQGEWERPRKVADWPAVIKLAGDAIATKSKDLQLAVWLTEAMTRREGFAGLNGGLTLIRGMLETFWDNAFPELEDGDTELRAAPIEWLGTRFEMSIKTVPLTKGGHDLIRYRESRAVPTETEAENDDAKRVARATALEEGKLPPEVVDKAFESTPKVWYRQLAGDLSAAIAALETLNELSTEKFGDDSPNLIPLREGLADVQRTVQLLLDKKLAADPDPVGETPSSASSESAPAGGSGGPSLGGPGGPPNSAAGSLTAEPVDKNDAANRVIGAARYLRKNDPTSPAGYLLLRGLRWGELRAQGNNPDPRLLDAPSAQARTQLKTLMLDSAWPELLEAAEQVMATPAGRGWLDLQRYVLNALAGMGNDFDFVASAIRRDLKGLLADIPTLPEMALMDDLPTAGPSTLKWLEAEGLMSGADGEGSDAPREAAQAPVSLGATAIRDRVLDRALAEVKAGRAPKALEIVKRELDRETSERGRFIRQAQLAKVMVMAGRDAMAIPVLQQLNAQIEEFKLEDWEAGGLVAEPLTLLYQALRKTDGDPEVQQALYVRICRLDPVQAMNFGSGSGDGESGA